MLLCGCQVANAQMLLCFFFLLNHPRPKRDLLLCVARHTAVTLTRNAPLSKAPSPGISVSRVEPSGFFISRFYLSSSRSLKRCLLLGQRSRMNFFSHHIRSLLHQDHGNPDTELSRHRHNGHPGSFTARMSVANQAENSLSSASFRIADQEAWIILLLKRSSPVRVIEPRSVLSPVECSVGTKPRNPPSWRMFLSSRQSPMRARS